MKKSQEQIKLHPHLNPLPSRERILYEIMWKTIKCKGKKYSSKFKKFYLLVFYFAYDS